MTRRLRRAQVGVGEYGEKENDDLRQRFNVDAKSFPQFFIFDKDPSKPLATFSGDIKADALTAFVSKHTGIWIGLPGCLEAFDKVAAKFVKATSADEKNKLAAEAEALDAGAGEDNQESAKAYVQIMRKAAAAEDFVDTEIKRVEKLLKTKLADKHKRRLERRQNILVSFAAAKKARDEL
jgi:endoplasmic reticulum protein 29